MCRWLESFFTTEHAGSNTNGDVENKTYKEGSGQVRVLILLGSSVDRAQGGLDARSSRLWRCNEEDSRR